jgi:hypothetical protein
MKQFLMYRDMQGNLQALEVEDEASDKQAIFDSGRQLAREYPIVATSEDDAVLKTRKADELRYEGSKLSTKAEKLYQNPQIQPEQSGGVIDDLGVGLSRFMFPIASSIAESGGDESAISRSASIEAPLALMNLNPAQLGAKEAIKQGAVYGAGTGLARYQGGQGVNPLELGLSALAPSAIGAGGSLVSKVGKTAEAVAPNVLHSVVVPKSGMMKGANPPDFEVALREGLVPTKGTTADQILGLESNIKSKVKGIAEERSALPEWKREYVSVIDDVFGNAENKLNDLGLDVSETRAVRSAIKRLNEEYADEWKMSWRTVEEAMKERTKLNASSKVFSTDDANMSAVKKAKALIAGEIGQEVGKLAPDVMQKTGQMAPYMGMLRPVENAGDLTRGKVAIPLGMSQAIIAGGTVGGIPGAIAGYGASKLMKSPGGAQTLHNLGRYAQKESPLSTLALKGASEQMAKGDNKKRKISDYNPNP